jgi:hypothetical protein
VDGEEFPPDLRGDGEHAFALWQRGRQRFFTHDVLFRTQSFCDELFMEVVWQQYADALHAVVTEQLVPTGVDARNVFCLRALVRPRWVLVEYADHFYVARSAQCLEVDSCHAAHADQRDP